MTQPQLTRKLIENISYGNKMGDRLKFEPDYIICRNKDEIEMAKRLLDNKLTKEEWCSYSKGAEKVLNKIWNEGTVV